MPGLRPGLRSVRRGAVGVLLLGLLTTLTTLVTVGAGATAPAHADDVPEPEVGAPWFGAELDWQRNDAASYVERLGTSVSLLSRAVSYPLTRSSTAALGDLAEQAAAEGAVAVVSLQPTAALADLGRPEAAALVDELDALTASTGSSFLLRFAPEMNGSWTAWGQQPAAYVRAFRAFAGVVHVDASAAATVWAPAYGAGYPFGGSIDDVSRGVVLSTQTPADQAALDTDDDGLLDSGDDPYDPYYPGDEAVDWVGLSMLRFGRAQRFGANVVPTTDELKDRLDDTFGYATRPAGPSFYRQYAEGRDQPMMLVTGALYNPRGSGATEAAVKLGWLRLVANAVRFRPALGAVVWLEDARYEPEVGNVVRWGLTGADLGDRVRRQLVDGDFDLGPVAAVDTSGSTSGSGSGSDEATPGADEQDGAAPEQAAARDDSGPLTPGVLAAIAAAVVVVAAGVALRVRRRRMRPPWL